MNVVDLIVALFLVAVVALALYVAYSMGVSSSLLSERRVWVHCVATDCTPLPNSSFKMKVYADYYYDPDRGMPEGLQHPYFMDNYGSVCRNLTCDMSLRDGSPAR
jgi:hypothetical protein